MTTVRLTTTTLALVLLLRTGTLGTAAQGKKGTRHAGHAMSTSEREQLLRHINAERRKHNLPPLRLSAKMDAQAQHWAEHLHKIGKLVHGDFKGDHGQCIAEGQPTTAAVTKAWMSDAGHRHILLGKHYHELGAGRAGKYWVTNFR